MPSQLLTNDALHDVLIALHDWSVNDAGDALHAKYSFRDFATALDFVNQISVLAEAANHHPDFTLGWGYVGLTLCTHDVGGITQKDVVLARQIAALKK